MAKSKSKKSKPAGLDGPVPETPFGMKVFLVTHLSSAIHLGIKYGTFAFLGWQAKQVFLSLAGQTTMANFALDILSNVKGSHWAAWGGTVTFAGYGLFERKLRRDTVKELHKRIRDKELERDPNRTSSQLTPRGETNPKDKP